MVDREVVEEECGNGGSSTTGGDIGEEETPRSIERTRIDRVLGVLRRDGSRYLEEGQG